MKSAVQLLATIAVLLLLNACGRSEKKSVEPTKAEVSPRPEAKVSPTASQTSISDDAPAGSGRSVGDRPFWILPIFDYITSHPTDHETIQTEMGKLKEQLGSNSERFKIGFSFIYGGNTGHLLGLCELAKINNLSLGVIISGSTHQVSEKSSMGKILAGDLRLYQWRLDGKTWKGRVKEAKGAVETGESPRDWKVPSPSRYATAVREYYHADVTRTANSVAEALKQYPEIIGVVNFAIEEELAVGGGAEDAFLADYSPYAVTEFRDWLRHRGLYDAGGKFAGQGAPTAITGESIEVDGSKVSPFHDDPTPADAHGTGQSFNMKFGTNFSTWELAFWDLEKFPKPITDVNFVVSPKEGDGANPGGFDAPRVRNSSPYWTVWSWDYHDQGAAYPPGNPENPAFGFRQTMIRHWVTDMGQAIRDAGVPESLIFPHQIPGEFWTAERDRSSASTIWSGYLPFNGNLGISFFGPVEVSKLTQYSDSWGIFQWHPTPNAEPDSDRLYLAGYDSLEKSYQANAYALFPGWWSKDGKSNKTFPLNNSRLADAIKDWLAAQEQPELAPSN